MSTVLRLVSTFVGIGAGIGVGYSRARVRHHRHMATAWLYLATVSKHRSVEVTDIPIAFGETDETLDRRRLVIEGDRA